MDNIDLTLQSVGTTLKIKKNYFGRKQFFDYDSFTVGADLP